MENEPTSHFTLWKIGSQQVQVAFDGGRLVSDAGLLAVRAIARKLKAGQKPLRASSPMRDSLPSVPWKNPCASSPTWLNDSPTRAPPSTSNTRPARAVAQRDGITTGLIGIFGATESCFSYEVRPNGATRKLELVRRPRKCLHYYHYHLHPQFGLLHLRLQTWFPFNIQIQ